jgi:hypothetical protein
MQIGGMQIIVLLARLATRYQVAIFRSLHCWLLKIFHVEYMPAVFDRWTDMLFGLAAPKKGDPIFSARSFDP